MPKPDLLLESRIHAIGRKLFKLMADHPAPGIFSRKGAYARIMDWSMRDPAFKAQLFRFVDVLPSLASSGEIVRHLREYLGDKAVELHPALKAGLGAASFAPALVAGPVKAQVTDMARQFVAGETAQELVRRLLANSREGIATTIDLLGETVVSEEEADTFLKRNLEIIDVVSEALRGSPEPCASDLGQGGRPLPRLNLSLKISALSADVNPIDPECSVPGLKQRLRPLLRRAAAAGALINFDMESHRTKDLTLALFRSILEEEEFAATPAVGIAIQAYLRDSDRDLRELIAWSRSRMRPITVRLVKGAYWDFEVVTSAQKDWPAPVWLRKSESDASFEALTVLLLENSDLVSSAFASHNVRSCAHAIVQAERLGVDPRAFEFQALYGMADELKAALRESGYRVREYCPVGELLPGMAYLVRRLLENTSNEGFLRASNRGEQSHEDLLKSPVESIAAGPPAPESADANAAAGGPVRGAFRNAANTDFSLGENRTAMRDALRASAGGASAGYFGKRWPLVIGGRRCEPSGRRYAPATNPARPAEVLGHWALATVEDAGRAVDAAAAAFPAWRSTPVETRASIIERLADLMASRRFALCALEIREAGKPWMEADADVSEAVDFCRFYALEMRRLAAPTVTQMIPGESNVLVHTPRGVGVAIAPWNFPLAILCGLTVAPLVAGNAVIMKPAEQTSIIGAVFMDLLLEAGVPPGVVNLVTGRGEEVGAHLVAHPRVDFIAFTGSRAVGLRIWETAGRTVPGQANLKKVVCEMGGKNALIIDADADLDEAVPAVLYSAFGFSGQKCSALSRLIVHEAIHDAFLQRLVAAAASLRVGDPAQPGTLVGPLIDAESRDRIFARVAEARRESRMVHQSDLPDGARASGGHYVPPIIFADVEPGHLLAREELFGPVLGVMRARSLDQAFALANATEYALTGGIFSRSPSALVRAREELLCGNLYLNRTITGALVERHPFGGFRMSGGGTKAGGRGYLENFLFPRVISENTLRRGFTPPEAPLD
ncbi:MAG: bifunctional proline dehydrogenase/L-glutamate gamma-semialdehyde dehydrogenase [Opitutaceae bacterium]|nr:bifunctional proline dehydrogenase/L-glutamate gamma-semialdehyde dehydrogenase [Opitutaceae bacterium]